MVIDSSALVAILRLESDAEMFARKIAGVDRRLISAVTLLETAVVLGSGESGAPNLIALDELIAHYEISTIAFDADQQVIARTAYLMFGKGHHPAALNICDCAAYALAKTRNLQLLFKGNDFAKTDVLVA